INAVQGILKHLRIDVVKFRTRLLDVNQLRRLGSKIDALTTTLPSIPSLLQRRVVQFAAKPQYLFQHGDLCRIWVETEFEGLSIRHLSDSQRTVSSRLTAHHQRSSRKLNLSIVSAAANADKGTLAARVEKKPLSSVLPDGECRIAGQLRPANERGQA